MDMETKIVKEYFNAWDTHDTDTILATFTTNGTYSDPVGGKNLTGQS